MHSASLPTGYTQLDKLEFNGSQWIETGYCPAAGDRFECDVTVDAVQTNATAAVFGTVRESEPERTFAFYVRQDGDDSTVVAYGDMVSGGFFPRGKKVTLSVGPDGATWTWEGGSGRIELMTPGFARDGVTPLLIGDANAARFVGDSVPAGTGAAMTLHRFRIWRGGLELLHDYVPCTNPAGSYGVFDEVDRKFLLRRQEIGFFVNGRDVGCGEGTCWSFEEGVLALTNATTYVLSGAATNDEVRVKATDEAKVVLSDMVVFTSKRPAIDVKQSNLTVAANQVLKAGDTPEALRYARPYNGERCVLAAPGVTVTVKDIPHVTGFTVSNAVEVITNSTHAATCRVMAGDDVYVGYTVEADCFSKSPNPLVYTAVESSVVVDANTIRILKNIPYRAWDAATWRMSDCVCSNYTVVATNTQTFADGQWYAVTGTVERGTITVSGSAHLILCDGAKMTADAITNGTLAVYGQPSGCGALEVSGTVATALTVQGGRISAKALAVGSLAVVGGTLAADAVRNDTVMIAGGSVKAETIENAPSNGVERVFCVTVKWEEGKREEGRGKRLSIEGLEGYGTNDIYAVKNDKGESCVYLWLPDGTHRFSVSDGATTNRYCAVVHGRGVTVEPLGPIGFFVNGEDIGNTGSGTGWNYNKNMKNLTLSEVGLYVLSGVAMNDEVHIHVAGEKAAGATVILSNAVVFVSGQPPALNVDQNISLLMAGGSSFLGATNDVMAISVGPKAALTVGLAPGADETEAIIGVFNYGDVAAIGGAGSVTVRGGTLAVWADKRAAETPINRTADVFCMLAGNDPETAKVVDTYNGELYVLVTAAIAPVTPGKPFGSFTTAEAATNVMKKAVLVPRDDVAKVLISEGLRRTYCDMFALAVTGGDESWFVEALLTPEARTNLAETATGATRQIPVAAIARLSDVSAIAQLPEDVTTNVTVNGCAPGFFYSLYDGWALTNIVADANATNLNVLCGADAKVVFPEVKKPSDAAGFFKVGVGVTDGVGKR